MWVFKTLVFLWNILLSADGSYSLIVRIFQIVGGGTMSIPTTGFYDIPLALRVLVAVVIFIAVYKIVDLLIALFKRRASTRILEYINKSEKSKHLLDTLRNMDNKLYSLAVTTATTKVAKGKVKRNAYGLLELLGMPTQNITKWRLILNLTFKPILWFQFRKQEFLFELAILMDNNQAGLNKYETMSLQLQNEVAYLGHNVTDNAFNFLKWSYGINSLLLFTSRDMKQVNNLLPTRVRIGIQKLAYHRPQMIEHLLLNASVKIGYIKGEQL